MYYPIRGRAVKARVLRLLCASALVLCALIAWATIARRPAASDSLHASAAPRPPSSALVASAEPAPTAAVSPRLQLEHQCLALAGDDPLAAMEFALKNKLTDDDPGLLPTLVMQWAAQDFDAACDWTKTQEAGPWRDSMLARLAYLRAQADPLSAARLVVADMPSGRARDEAIISVVHQWALRDADAAAHWVQSFDDEALRLRAATEVANLLAASAPDPVSR